MASAEAVVDRQTEHQFHDFVPEEWREKYQDLSVTNTSNGQQYLYGVKANGKKDGPLPWGSLDEAVNEAGFDLRPQPEQDLIRERNTLVAKVTELSERLDALEESLGDIAILVQRNAELEAQNQRLEAEVARLRAGDSDPDPVDPTLTPSASVASVSPNQGLPSNNLSPKQQELLQSESDRLREEMSRSVIVEDLDDLQASVVEKVKEMDEQPKTQEEEIRWAAIRPREIARIRDRTVDEYFQSSQDEMPDKGTVVRYLQVQNQLEGNQLDEPWGVREKRLTSPNRLRRGRTGRLFGGIGDFILGRQVALQNGVYSYANRDGSTTVVEEEVIEGHPESSIVTGERAVVGGVALLAAGVVIGWAIDRIEDYFEYKHGVPRSGIGTTIHEGTKTVTHTVTQSPSNTVQVLPPVTHGAQSGQHLVEIGGRHIDYYNSAPGHKLTGVENPKILHLQHNLGGDHSLVDNRGKTIINQVEWDRQGNLSRATRAAVRAKGFLLSQGQLGKRYMTEVWRR